MRAKLLLLTTVTLAMVTGTAGAAFGQSTGTDASIKRAKAAFERFLDEHDPSAEDEPAALAFCPFGDQLMTDLAGLQPDYDDASTSAPTVSASVFVDETIDDGTRSVPCTVEYDNVDGDTSSVTLVVYADPGLTTVPFAKALAKHEKAKLRMLKPRPARAAGGKVEGYCLSGSSNQCAYVWSRGGLYVEIDTGAEARSNFTELPTVVGIVTDGLPDIGVGVN